MRRSLQAVIKHIATKKRIYEVTVCIVAVLVVAFIASRITPAPVTRGDSPVYLQMQSGKYYRADVKTVNSDTLTVTVADGPLKGQERTLPYASFTNINDITEGSTVLLREDADTLSIHTKWYVPFILILTSIFLAVIALVGRRRGLASVLGLMMSVAIIGLYIIPQLLSGANAFFTIIFGAFMIAIASIYTAHGVNRRTTISVIAICCVLVVVACLSYLAIWLGGISGNTGEAAVSLAINNTGMDLRGILAGSIVIATLGILDDVVTTQVAAIDKLRQANPRYTIYALYRHGMDVGREHIAALVNTLALAYIGVSLPIVLLFASGQTFDSFLLFINSAFITQEIVRTIVSSLGLVIAVPISTILAAWLIKRWHK